MWAAWTFCLARELTFWGSFLNSYCLVSSYLSFLICLLVILYYMKTRVCTIEHVHLASRTSVKHYFTVCFVTSVIFYIIYMVTKFKSFSEENSFRNCSLLWTKARVFYNFHALPCIIIILSYIYFLMFITKQQSFHNKTPRPTVIKACMCLFCTDWSIIHNSKY